MLTRLDGIAMGRNKRQLENEKFPKAVTDVGMETERKDVQPWKADVPMSDILVGMLTEVNPPQPWKADSPIAVRLELI